jgi:hypothetical protein
MREHLEERGIQIGVSLARYVEEKVRLKIRAFNSGSNVEQSDLDAAHEEWLQEGANEYRRRSKGGL